MNIDTVTGFHLLKHYINSALNTGKLKNNLVRLNTDQDMGN